MGFRCAYFGEIRLSFSFVSSPFAGYSGFIKLFFCSCCLRISYSVFSFSKPSCLTKSLTFTPGLDSTGISIFAAKLTSNPPKDFLETLINSFSFRNSRYLISSSFEKPLLFMRSLSSTTPFLRM